MEDFRSIVLSRLGIEPDYDLPEYNRAADQFKKMYEILNERDINLGKINFAEMTNKQINCLMGVNSGFAHYRSMCFLNDDMELILTTQYRYQEEHQKTRYRVSWMTWMIDFVMGKRQDIGDDE